MNHQSLSFGMRQRSALQVGAGISMYLCDAPPRALAVVMR
jgi:hypothetical protein